MKRKLLFAMLIVLTTMFLSAGYVSAKQNHLPDVKKFTLDNGLVLLVVERHDSSTVQCFRFHGTGAMHEHHGIRNSSHLYEHMMFKGTKKIGTWNYEAEKPIMEEMERIVDEIDREMAKEINDYQKADQEKIDRLWKKVEELQQKQSRYIIKHDLDNLYKEMGSYGADAMTNFDNTIYYVTLPANRLEGWVFLDADTLKEPVFREFYSERKVLLAERNMLISDPSRVMRERLYSTMYPMLEYSMNVHSLRPAEMLEYYKKFYAPNKTVLVLVGNVDAQEAYHLVKKYYGDIPAQPEPRPILHFAYSQNEERRVEIEMKWQPLVSIGFHGPKPGHPDQYAMELLLDILTAGGSGRFYENIIGKNTARRCSGFLSRDVFANFIIIEASLGRGVTTSQLEKAIYAEFERLKTEPVSASELEKVKNWHQKAFLSRIRSRFSLARTLAWNQHWTGDWRNFDNRDKIRAVTAEDIMRVANKYLVKSNRTVVTLVPPEKVQNTEMLK
jgi:predicted Zn-dependent peptidase